MGRDPAILAVGITKTYGTTLALDAVDFAAGWGEVTGLLGPNGAGKTTLIRVLTGILGPTRGRFTVAGCDQDDTIGIRRRVGVLPESSGYPKHKRALDHLVYHGRLYGLDRDQAETRAAGLLRDVGLAAQGGDRIGTFSRGMRQRLGIARTLVNDPDVLFLDEPTLGLDPAGQREILELVVRLASERQAAVVLTSHLLHEVERTADRIVILDHGRVVLDRPSDRPKTAVTVTVDADALDAAVAAAQVLGLEVRPLPPVSMTVTVTGDADVRRLLAALSEGEVTVRRLTPGSERLMDEFLEVTTP